MRRFGIALLWLCWRVLPARGLGAVGEMLGGLLYFVAGDRRKVAAINLRLCFPALTEAEHDQLLRQHFRALGRASLQETVSWWGSRAEVVAMTRLEEIQHVTPHLGKPLILFAPHFVGVSIAGVRLTSSEFAPLVTLNAKVKNPYIHQLAFQARRRFARDDLHSEIYERKDGIKPVIRAVKKGLPFYYPPDLDFGRKDALFIPLFGTPAATITGLSRVARVTGAVVVPCITRQDHGGYVTRFYPAWENFPTADVEADTRRMNAFIEDRIREMPEQYFWVHKRFKTRPEGAPSLYG
jgi:Kdo2-lipid IVA lauroyltransferase/acyltransferase